jgi:putative membrane protein
MVCLICLGHGPAIAQSSQPQNFLDRAIEMNHAEIQLGRLAIDKAQNEQVMEFAHMIVRDHTAALKKLEAEPDTTGAPSTTRREKPDARMENVDRSVLTPEHQRTLDRLSRMSGPQFDREFIDLMVRQHRSAVQMFEREASGTPQHDHNTSGVDTADLAREMLPKLRNHLIQAEQIRKHLR